MGPIFGIIQLGEVAALVAVASTGVALCSIVICIGIFCLNRWVCVVNNWHHNFWDVVFCAVFFTEYIAALIDKVVC